MAALTNMQHPAVRKVFRQGSSTPCRAQTLVCQVAKQQQRQQQREASSLDRRQALLGLAAVVAAARAAPAQADEETPSGPAETVTFYGMATPPTSYGGYGGNNKVEDAKYIFEYPAGWKVEVVNKTQKGTQGIDARVTNPRKKREEVFVITFGRAGEDNKSFKLTDIESTFAGFAGADYDMQDALGAATEQVLGQREVGGQTYYDVQIDSPEVQYLSTITVNNGKVYAMFVKSPTRSFADDEALLRGIITSFHTVNQPAS